MTDGQGHQVCLFPLTQMDITQWNGPGTYSHCCGHMADYGTNRVRTPVYAPCDMHLTYDAHTSAHTLFYCSDQQVLTPSGLSWVSIQLTHDQNPPYLMNVKQGEVIYHSGNAGAYSLGIHLHLDQSLQKDAIWYKTGMYCATDCYTIRGTIDPQFVFFINDTAIIDDRGLDWKYFDAVDPPIPPEPPHPEPPQPPAGSGGNFKWYLYKQLFDRRFR